MSVSRAGYILDADVLIDYRGAPRILSLFARHMGPLFVAPAIAAEAKIPPGKLPDYGIQLIEPELGQAEAASVAGGGLSYQDHLCLILCEARSLTCATNDKKLRSACGKRDIPVLWGLAMMVRLVEGGHLSPNDAWGVARTIGDINPRVTQEVLDRFRSHLGLH